MVNVTKDTNNVTLHALDMKINEASTSIKEYPLLDSGIKELSITSQDNDTDRQFHVIKLRETLRAGKQYIVHLKFVGNLNDHLQGFYRSSYNVGNQTRYVLIIVNFKIHVSYAKLHHDISKYTVYIVLLLFQMDCNDSIPTNRGSSSISLLRRAGVES